MGVREPALWRTATPLLVKQSSQIPCRGFAAHFIHLQLYHTTQPPPVFCKPKATTAERRPLSTAHFRARDVRPAAASRGAGRFGGGVGLGGRRAGGCYVSTCQIILERNRGFMFNSPSSTKDERLVAGRAHARGWLGSAVMRRRRPPDWCRRMRRAAFVRRVWCAWWVGGLCPFGTPTTGITPRPGNTMVKYR